MSIEFLVLGGGGVFWVRRPRMSGRRTSGSSRSSLGVQVLAVFSFIFQGKSQIKKCLGERLEVPDIRLADVRGLLIGFLGGGGVPILFLWARGFF